MLSIAPANLGNAVSADTWFSFEDQKPLGEKVYRSVEDYSYSADVRNVSSWSGHANIEITFTNTGNSTIHDWYFTFDYSYAIENPFNCYIVEHQDNLYTIGNNNWNQDIAPGQSVTVGFTAATSDGSAITDTPTFYLLNTKTITLSSSDLSYRFEQYSDWGAGYNGALLLTNNCGETIRDWSITFNSNRSITQIDSGVITTNSDGSYTIVNDGNNQNISNRQTQRIGVQGGQHDSSVPFELSNYSVYAKKLAYNLGDDTNGNGVLDVLEIDDGGFILIVTPTPDETVTPTPEISDTPTPLITDIPEDIDYYTDTDEDFIPDNLEDYYGTDKNDPDTDNDGILDGYELMAELDPLDPDSDGDGINDGDEDSDGDGLTNSQESELGTNPVSSDTDMDDLTDLEEVYTYGTDPSKWDTDGDEISDFDEIRMGLDPLSSDSDGNGIPDTDERILQSKTVELTDSTHPSGVNSVTVKAGISGCMDHNTRIEDVYFDDCVSSMIDGAIGVPVDISTKGSFDEAELIFEYNEDELGDSQAEDLVICWIDYDNGEIVPLDSTVDEANHTVSAATTHFSQYFLLDLRAYRKMWRENIAKALEYQGDRPVSQNNAFVVAIQMSDDLTLEQKQQEYDMVQAMLENLRPSDYITLIGYGGNENGYYAPYPHGITDNVRGNQEDAKEEILDEAYRWLFNYHDQPTNNSTSVERVYTVLESIFYQGFDGGAYNNQFVLVTNGNAGDIGCSFWYAEVDGDRYNYDFNVVMLGNTDVSTMAKCYMLYTDGSGIQLSDPDINPEDVISILYERLEYNGLWQDTDSDTIPDEVEKHPILTSYGYFVHSNPDNDDTDYDGLKDNEELGMNCYIMPCLTCFDQRKGKLTDQDRAFIENYGDILTNRLTCYKMTSNPADKDTDDDGAGDAVDATPMKMNGSINYILFGHSDNLLDETARGYYRYINNHYDKYSECLLFDIGSYDEIENILKGLQYKFDYSINVFTDKIAYTNVDNLIIVAHGMPDGEYLSFNDLRVGIEIHAIKSKIVPLITCAIQTVDLEVCYMGKKTSDNLYFADEFLNSSLISEAYGAYGTTNYNYDRDKTLAYGGMWRFRRDGNNKRIIDGGVWFYRPMWRVA